MRRARPAPDIHTPAAATPMAYARVIAAAYARRGLDATAALRAAQILPSRLQQVDACITAAQMETLSAAAMRELDDEGLGAFSRQLPWGSYGMLARASLTSPTLGLALQRWCRHHGLIADDIALRLEQRDQRAAIVIHERDGTRLDAAAREFRAVHVLRNIHGLACWYIDSRIPLQLAAFPHAAPPHHAAFRHMFPGVLSFGAERAEIQFDARYLQLALRRDEKALRQMLQRALPLTVLQYRRDRLLVQQVRQLLVADPSAAHSAESVAQALHMSSRTLHRQLAEESASLQQIKDEVRCERAKDLLCRTRRPVKQVAAASGFTNEKSFTRAFRQWTGTSPAQFRGQL